MSPRVQGDPPAGQAPPGEHLRWWRTRRELSQMRVAEEYGMSARHLSFVETGRARPSRELIVHLARSLEATNHEMNVCLLAGGYAPLHVGELAGGPATSQTIDEMIAQHHPFPAYVFSADWVVEQMNPGGGWFCTVFMPDMPPEFHRIGVDMVAALTETEGMLSRMRNAAKVGSAYLRQLRLEQLSNPGLRERVDRFEMSLRERFPGEVESDEGHRTDSSYHIDFDTIHGPLSIFQMQCVVGIPQQITVATPRVELWFPADEHTRKVIAQNAPTPASG